MIHVVNLKHFGKEKYKKNVQSILISYKIKVWRNMEDFYYSLEMKVVVFLGKNAKPSMGPAVHLH